MTNKIIKKEKERQDFYLRMYNICSSALNSPSQRHLDIVLLSKDEYQMAISTHKKSLISLKEYIEELFEGEMFFFTDGCESCKHSLQEGREQVALVKEDIKELTKMIENYK